jgi:hypothetical protein
MKKTLLVFFTVLLIIALSACSLDGNTLTTTDTQIQPLSSETSLATLSYLSAGFLTTSDPVAGDLLFLASTEKARIEDNMEVVNVYFDRLRSLIDNGVDSFGSATQEVSDREGFAFKLTFTVNDETYLIYYNVDEVTGEMSGIIIINTVEYEFEVLENKLEYEYEYEHEEQNGNTEDNELDDEAEATVTEATVDTEDSTTEETDVTTSEDAVVQEVESKMVLLATNGTDTIKIVYKTEVEEDESVTKFELEQNIGGVTKEVSMKIVQEEDHYKVKIEENGDSYTFKRELNDDGTYSYRLEYEVDGVRGWVMIQEKVDETGAVYYEYKIHENDIQKDVEKGKPHYDFDDDDAETEPESGNDA